MQYSQSSTLRPLGFSFLFLLLTVVILKHRHRLGLVPCARKHLLIPLLCRILKQRLPWVLIAHTGKRNAFHHMLLVRCTLREWRNSRYVWSARVSRLARCCEADSRMASRERARLSPRFA